MTTRQLNIVATLLSVFIPVTVLILLTPDLLPKLNLPFDPYALPKFYAGINAFTAFILLAALYFIKKKNMKVHMRLIYTAMSLSAIFLVCYILYHWSTDPTSYGGQGIMRNVYYFLLLSHILLSAVLTPFVLFTFVRGFTGQYDRHKRLARWAFPMWLYVCVSGVLCYLMIAPYYPV
ncbi:MAG: DUF420 domain-containing protein [Bacteroidota bacterium]